MLDDYRIMFIFVPINSFQQSRNTGQMRFKCGELYVQWGNWRPVRFCHSQGRTFAQIAQEL